MFATNAPTGFNDQAFSDAALNKTTNPVGVVHSALDGFAASFMAPELGITEAGDYLQGKAAQLNPQLAPFLQTPKDISGAHTLYNQLSDNASQNSISGDIGSIAGFTLNPLNWVTGGMGGSLADGFAAVGSRVLPGLAAKTPALVAAGAKAAVAGAVSLLPAAIPSSYNPSTNSLDWGGVAKNTAYGVGMGMALGAGLVGLGIAGGKAYAFVKAKSDAEPMADNTVEPSPQEAATNSLALSQANLDDALSNKAITPDEHEALTSYINKDDNNTVQALGAKVAAKNGVQGDVNITFLKPSDLQNLSTIAGDGLAADVAPELKSALSDYMLNKNIDDIRQDPVKMAALQGFSDHMEGRLANQADELGQLDDAANSARNEDIPENPAVNNLQGQIDNVNTKLKGLTDSSEIDQANKSLEMLSSRLEAAKGESHPEINDELDTIRQNLTKPDVSPNDLRGKDYRRLNNLAMARNPYAEAILNRVNQGAKYNEQAAYKTIADNLLEMNKQGIAPQAALSKVTDYLKVRNGSKVRLTKDEPKVVNNADKVDNLKPENIKAQIDDLRSQEIEPKAVNDAMTQYSMADRFKSSVGHLADFIQCLAGGLSE